MNKQDFLNQLNRGLKKLKKEERIKYLDYYQEIISDIMENGASEEEAIKRQGNPEKIAEDILANVNPAEITARDLMGICLVVLSIILTLFSLIPLILRMQMQVSFSKTVGIIGGADGPTSVFVAGKIGTPWGLYIATAIVIFATVIYFIRKRKNK